MGKKRGLDDWFGKENWVDISAPKKGGGYEKCGRKSADDSERGYPKCVPAAKAAKMSKKQVASAVRRKRAKKQGVGGKPTNVSTFAAEGGSIMKMKTKGYRKGGAPSKGAVSDKEFEKFKKAKGKAMGGAMKTKGYAKGGAGKKEDAMQVMIAVGKPKAGMMRAKGKAMGGAMKTKGYAKGGAMGSKAKSSPVRPPSSKNSGLYGR